jgi:hypothetical protein
MIRHPKTAGWLALNVIGAAAYIRVASRSWVEPELANVPEAHGGGAAFVWFLGAAPILFAFLVLNLGVVAWAFSQRRRGTEWPLSKLAGLVPVLWLGVVIVDFAHH